MYFQKRPVTDNWKTHFPMDVETPCFFAHHAEIHAYPTTNSGGVIKFIIEFFDSTKKLVIKTETTQFCMDIMQPDLDESPRWHENDFSQLTNPIYFYDTDGSAKDEDIIKISDIYLNNNGTEDWYEFIIDQTDADIVAEVNVHSFEFHHHEEC